AGVEEEGGLVGEALEAVELELAEVHEGAAGVGAAGRAGGRAKIRAGPVPRRAGRRLERAPRARCAPRPPARARPARRRRPPRRRASGAGRGGGLEREAVSSPPPRLCWGAYSPHWPGSPSAGFHSSTGRWARAAGSLRTPVTCQ